MSDVLGAGAATSAYLGSRSAKEAQEANLAMARETRDANALAYAKAMGAYGNKFTPLYFGDFEGTTLKTDAQTYYQAGKDLQGTPWEQYNRYKTALDAYQPLIAGGDASLADIYSGRQLQQRVDAFNPVAGARVAGARSQSNSIMDSLQATKNQIAAMNQAKGFSGGNTFTDRNLLGATIGARGAAAQSMSAANLANAQDMRQIQDMDIATRLQYLNAPFERGQQAISYMQLPINMVQQNASRSLQPFQNFWGGSQPFQVADLPMVGAIPSGAQIALTGLGSGGNAIGSYYMNKSLANQYGQRNGVSQAQVNQGYSEMGMTPQGQFVPQYNTGQYSASSPASYDYGGGGGGGYYDIPAEF